MPMKLERIRAVSRYYATKIQRDMRGLGGKVEPKAMPHLKVNANAALLGFPQAHLLDMLRRLDIMVAEGLGEIAMLVKKPGEDPTTLESHREKIMRWYGFAQGALWALGIFTVDELKDHSRPDVPPPGAS